MINNISAHYIVEVKMMFADILIVSISSRESKKVHDKHHVQLRSSLNERAVAAV
jgi:hypothetical protein